jgi:hypothetical protein
MAVTEALGSAAWTVANRYVVGASGVAGATAFVTHASGTLAVTNHGSAAIVVGGVGSPSTFTLSGGAVLADRLLATNNTAATTNSTFVFTGGTLVTSNAANQIASILVVASNAGTTAVLDVNGMWKMTGGTNLVRSTAGAGNFGTVYVGDNVSAATAMVSQATWDLGKLGLGVGYRGTNSHLLIGAGAVVTNVGAFTVGYVFQAGVSPRQNSVLVTNGGRLFTSTSGTAGSIVGNAGRTGADSSSNSAVVTGVNSLWDVGGAALSIGANSTAGRYATGNFVRVESGGMLTNVGALTVGASQGGGVAYGNQLVITNGGKVFATSLLVGASPSSVTGTNNNNMVRVMAGGLLEVNTMGTSNLASTLSSGNTISNLGGIFQFTSATPTLSPGTYGNVSLTGGTISFRGITNADVMGSLGNNQLSNLLFGGNNAFRLNGASNWSLNSQNYTFDTGSPSNYAGLEMVNGNTAWRSAWLNVGASGTMLVSNTSASVASVVTNLGSVTVLNAAVTWNGNVVNQGAYVSDPSTNTFNGDFTVGPAGFVSAASGDVYAFGKDFTMQSTNAAFALSSAKVYFGTNGYNLATTTSDHTLDVSGSGAKDIGSAYTNFSQVASDFAFGTLSIGTSNRLILTGTLGVGFSNALYVGVLDIPWASTNSFAEVTNSLFHALDLPNVNLYYDGYNSQNAWLNQYLPPTGYDLWGGGMLLPIPEPTPLALVALGLAAARFLRRRR